MVTVCPVQGCSREFSRFSDLRRHQIVHNVNTRIKHACPVEGCTKAYCYENHLIVHLRGTHKYPISTTTRSVPQPTPRAITRRITQPKLPVTLARSLARDRVNNPNFVDCQLGVFSIYDYTHDSQANRDAAAVNIKLEEEGDDNMSERNESNAYMSESAPQAAPPPASRTPPSPPAPVPLPPAYAANHIRALPAPPVQYVHAPIIPLAPSSNFYAPLSYDPCRAPAHTQRIRFNPYTRRPQIGTMILSHTGGPGVQRTHKTVQVTIARPTVVVTTHTVQIPISRQQQDFEMQQAIAYQQAILMERQGQLSWGNTSINLARQSQLDYNAYMHAQQVPPPSPYTPAYYI